jgi:Carbohydrate esterase, sialic acid-specific acetylesterase
MSRTAVIAWAPLMLLACGVTEVPRPESGPRPPDPPAGPPASGGAPTTSPPPGSAGGVPVSPDPAPAMGGRGGASPPTTGGAPPGPPSPPAATPPPSSGQTISINGTAVPKEKVLVFLHIGHSNMAGRTTTPQSLRPLSFETHPQLWSYGRGGLWKPAKEPLSADSMTGSCGGVGCSGLPAGAGPGMSILRAALAAAPDAYVVSIGRGQSGLTGGFCRSFRKGGLLYDFVMAPAMELKGKVTFAAIFTMLGLSEVNDRQNNARFGES